MLDKDKKPQHILTKKNKKKKQTKNLESYVASKQKNPIPVERSLKATEADTGPWEFLRWQENHDLEAKYQHDATFSATS